MPRISGGRYHAVTGNHTIRRPRIGAEGLLVGFLHPDGSIDTELTRRFVELSAPLPVTFHRAFDECADPLNALEQIIECGCARILTSGCKPTAIEGAEMLQQLVKQADGRITILAGSGVTPENVVTLREKTGVKEIHGSCKKTRPDGAWETDAEEVRKLILQLLSTAMAMRYRKNVQPVFS